MEIEFQTTNAASGNNQVLTLKAGTTAMPHEAGIGFTNVTVTFSAPPKGDFWKNSATEGSEYIVRIQRRSKS